VARRGSWWGGGSTSALAAALAGALLEKLEVRGAAARRLRASRREAAALAARDAVRFAAVIAASRRGRGRGFSRALKSATAVQLRVFALAGALQRSSARMERSVKTQFRSDLRCAAALARAASVGARELAITNARWLAEPAYTAHVTRAVRMKPRSR